MQYGRWTGWPGPGRYHIWMTERRLTTRLRASTVAGSYSVAEIVRRQNEPYRAVDVEPDGAGRPSGPPLSSRIIKAANAFDDLVGSSLDPGHAAAAVQRLRLDTASEYDPATVEALNRVVSRRSVIQM